VWWVEEFSCYFISKRFVHPSVVHTVGEATLYMYICQPPTVLTSVDRTSGRVAGSQSKQIFSEFLLVPSYLVDASAESIVFNNSCLTPINGTSFANWNGRSKL